MDDLTTLFRFGQISVDFILLLAMWIQHLRIRELETKIWRIGDEKGRSRT